MPRRSTRPGRSPLSRVASSVTALMLLSAMLLVPRVAAVDTWTGSWQTDFGAMKLSQSGSSVKGTYTHDQGRIRGTADRALLSGTWSEAPTYRPPDDAGDVQLRMSVDGLSFTGRWRYGSSGDWSSATWTGTRTTPIETAVPVKTPAPRTPAPARTPRPTQSPAVTAPPAAGGSDLRLAQVSLPDGIPGVSLTRVLAGGPGFIAVGGGYSSTEGTVVPLILTSVDGRTWQHVALTGRANTGQIMDMVAFSGGFAAVGQRTGNGAGGEQGAVWLSADGSSWESLPAVNAFSGAEVRAVTTWGGGLLAVGCALTSDSSCLRDVAWTSSDGRTWQRSTLPFKPAFDIRDVASDGKLLLVVGGSGIQDVGSPIAAISSDGTQWAMQDLAGQGVLSSATMVGDGSAVGVGTAIDFDNGDSGVAVRSADGGATWTVLDAGPHGSGFSGMSVADDALVYGCQGKDDCSDGRPAAWSVPSDGGQLQPIPVDASMTRAVGALADFASFIDQRGGIAVGWVETDVGRDPAIWVIAPEPGTAPTPGPVIPTPSLLAPTPSPVAPTASPGGHRDVDLALVLPAPVGSRWP